MRHSAAEPVAPRAAALMTLAAPGAGQASCGEFGRGVVCFSLVFASLGLLRWSLIACALVGLSTGALVAVDAARGARRLARGEHPRRVRVRTWLLCALALLFGASGLVWAIRQLTDLAS